MKHPVSSCIRIRLRQLRARIHRNHSKTSWCVQLSISPFMSLKQMRAMLMYGEATDEESCSKVFWYKYFSIFSACGRRSPAASFLKTSAHCGRCRTPSRTRVAASLTGSLSCLHDSTNRARTVSSGIWSCESAWLPARRAALSFPMSSQRLLTTFSRVSPIQRSLPRTNLFSARTFTHRRNTLGETSSVAWRASGFPASSTRSSCLGSVGSSVAVAAGVCDAGKSVVALSCDPGASARFTFSDSPSNTPPATERLGSSEGCGKNPPSSAASFESAGGGVQHAHNIVVGLAPTAKRS
mmetsp:Transcript_20684/g.57712  ORF Transcript_20684/g.57712 Transcript_20684/m.57712 type:complete len:296 (+) Transcript_20684:478-1365(+)